jgi:hypothetical protein
MLVVALCLVVSPTAAGILRLEGLGWGGVYDGYFAGEFRVTTQGIPGHADDVEWRTFCVEIDETIDLHTWYDAVVNDTAIDGGAPPGDPLDPATAWLFTQYLEGNTVGGIDLGNMSNQIAMDLQLAIWYLEDEIASSAVTAGQTSLVSAAEACGWSDLGNIRVLNLYELNSDHELQENYRQDLLVQIPVPSAVVLGAVGLCLVGVGGWVVRRRLD